MAAFSFNEFYQRNRRVVIWVILFLLLWALRDFFAIVFLTFVLAIIAAPLAEVGVRRARLPHWVSVTLVYIFFLVVLGSFVRFVVPSVASIRCIRPFSILNSSAMYQVHGCAGPAVTFRPLAAVKFRVSPAA